MVRTRVLEYHWYGHTMVPKNGTRVQCTNGTRVPCTYVYVHVYVQVCAAQRQLTRAVGVRNLQMRRLQVSPLEQVKFKF